MRKKILTRVAFSLNGALFLLGGIVLIDEGKLVLGIIQLLASILNISMIIKISNKQKVEKLNYVILAMNVVVCLSIAIDYMLANTSYIQYVWILAAIVSLIALLIQMKKR